MHAAKRIGGYTFGLVSARIRVAGISVDPTVLVAHVAGPWPIDGWRGDLDRLPVTLLEAAEQTVRRYEELDAGLDLIPAQAQ